MQVLPRSFGKLFTAPHEQVALRFVRCICCGQAKDIAGRVERQAGEWTGSAETEAKGALRQAEGKTQNVWGKAKDAAGKAADDAQSREKEREKTAEDEAEAERQRRKQVRWSRA